MTTRALERGTMRIDTEARVTLDDGRIVTATGTRIVSVGKPARDDVEGPSATVGFGSVRWRGKLYWLRGSQPIIVAHLWEAWQAGEPFVAGSRLLDNADTEAVKLKDLFADSDAWGELIVPGPRLGGPVGTYCLGFAAAA